MFYGPVSFEEREVIMAEQDKDKAPPESATAPAESGGAAVKTKGKVRKAPKKRPPEMLPPWKVLLHNDDKNDIFFVIRTVVELTPLNEDAAKQRTEEANDTGLSLLLVTHKERAELYQEQFQSKGLTVTIEPADK
jgi:ATP-dependent Clp protease adaptor protein ClpS